jgi:hypothetical protein
MVDDDVDGVLVANAAAGLDDPMPSEAARHASEAARHGRQSLLDAQRTVWHVNDSFHATTD